MRTLRNGISLILAFSLIIICALVLVGTSAHAGHGINPRQHIADGLVTPVTVHAELVPIADQPRTLDPAFAEYLEVSSTQSADFATTQCKTCHSIFCSCDAYQVTLSTGDGQALMRQLADDPTPNAALLKAAKTYRTVILPWDHGPVPTA